MNLPSKNNSVCEALNTPTASSAEGEDPSPPTHTHMPKKMP